MSEALCQSLSSLFKKAKKALSEDKPLDGLSYLKFAENIISNQSTPASLKCETFFQLANYFQALGQRQMSIKYLTTIFKLTQNPVTLAKAHLNLGFILSLQGLHQKSIYHNSKALTLLQNTEEYEGIVSAYHSLGLGFNQMSQFPRSLDAYKRGLIVSKTHLGVNHKLTKILRSLYLETSKNISLLGCRNHLQYKEDSIDIGQLVADMDAKVLRRFPQQPKFLSSGNSPVPKSRNTLTRSVQCGTEDGKFLDRAQRHKNGSVQTRFRRKRFSACSCDKGVETNLE